MGRGVAAFDKTVQRRIPLEVAAQVAERQEPAVEPPPGGAERCRGDPGARAERLPYRPPLYARRGYRDENSSYRGA